MGSSATGFIQAIDTDLHRCLKALYRNEETDLTLKVMSVDMNKVPATKREDMITILISAWKIIKIHFAPVFKKTFAINLLNPIWSDLAPPPSRVRFFSVAPEVVMEGL